MRGLEILVQALEISMPRLIIVDASESQSTTVAFLEVRLQRNRLTP